MDDVLKETFPENYYMAYQKLIEVLFTFSTQTLKGGGT